MCCESPLCCLEISDRCSVKETEDNILGSCHNLWCRAFPDGCVIFMEDHIPLPMESVFNTPMPTYVVSNLMRNICFLPNLFWNTGNAYRYICCDLSLFGDDSCLLPYMGESWPSKIREQCFVR